MAQLGNGPQPTSPVFASDEIIAIQAPGDFAMLVPPGQIMASGSDGVFAADAPWTLTSATNDFQAQGVAPQSVVWLTGPKSQYPGGGHLLAVDSVSGNSVTLRRIGQQLNAGWPPGPATGLSAVAFSVPTLGPQIEVASYRIKDLYTIDEAIWPRNSDWMYAGAEDKYRCVRDAVVFQVLVDRYQESTRSDRGDFTYKAKRNQERLEVALDRVQVRWGPFGNSAAPTTRFNMKVSR